MYCGIVPKCRVYVPAGAPGWLNEVPLPLYVAGPVIVNLPAVRFVVTLIVPVVGIA